MGTHIIPRADVKGQDRFFIIFTVSGLIGTLIGITIGFPFYAIFKAVNLKPLGMVIITLLGATGFVIGQVKIPDTNAFPLFKKVGGEYIKDIILRAIKFKKNKRKYANEISTMQNFANNEDVVENILLNKKNEDKRS